ncbi:MAG: hypothetical protein KC931_23925 [Candidatus Omnitrophica bacterium]|nr:hypothetical protein [Candidatus Omnitrophota bacterium]
MPDSFNAFLTNELVLIGDEDQIRKDLVVYRNADEVIEVLRPFFGGRLIVSGYGFAQGSGVLYYLKDTNLKPLDKPVWEECLRDVQIDDGDRSFCRASDYYSIRMERIDGTFFVVIRDPENRVFSQTWHIDPKHRMNVYRKTAQIRNRVSFEHRLGFDGDHCGWRETAKENAD